MNSEDKQNELAWAARKNAILHQEYRDFLKEREYQAGPDAAHSFAMHSHNEGRHRDRTDREIIIELEGKLPFGF